MADYYTHSIDTTVRKFKNLQNEIQRANARLNQLRSMRKEYSKELNNFMEREGLSTFEGITKKSVEKYAVPYAQRRKTLPKSKRREITVQRFREIGVHNPEELYMELQDSYTIKRNDEE